jgi:hypothetical protein
LPNWYSSAIWHSIISPTTTVVDGAIRLVEERTRFISNSRDNEEYKEPDYDHDNEEDTGETEESITTNQVF